MKNGEALQTLWNQLRGEDLSGVVFVRDYLQRQFDPPPQLNVYSSRVVVSSNGRSAAFGEEPFANMIVSLIGHVVADVRWEVDRSFAIVFADGAQIIISLLPEHRHGPESLAVEGRNQQWVVI